jgi:hypothetical protein
MRTCVRSCLLKKEPTSVATSKTSHEQNYYVILLKKEDDQLVCF